MQRAESEVGGGNIIHQHSKAVNIEHLREGQVLVQHLAIDRVQPLLATEHPRLYARLVQLAGEAFQDARQQLATVATRRLERTR